MLIHYTRYTFHFIPKTLSSTARPRCITIDPPSALFLENFVRGERAWSLSHVPRYVAPNYKRDSEVQKKGHIITRIIRSRVSIGVMADLGTYPKEKSFGPSEQVDWLPLCFNGHCRTCALCALTPALSPRGRISLHDRSL
jgi:hypothetical protein